MSSPYANCPECDRLWKHYTRLVAEHAAAQSRANATLATHDIPAYRYLEADAHTARRRRNEAAAALLDHQRREHRNFEALLRRDRKRELVM